MTGKDAQRSQLEYITAERKRYKALQRALTAYRAKAYALGLHPLDRMEIHDRLKQLDGMELEAKTPAYVASQQAFIDFITPARAA